jgi:UDP-hydrolysing UDP-N-acetyl-D-glucosamine 2-epimerase
VSLKVCAVSGGRADFGLLLEPMRRLRDDPAFSLSVVLTGQHLVPGASDGAAVVGAERFQSVIFVDMQLSGDDAIAISEASGRALAGLARAYSELRPDITLLPGDRYEIVVAALAATLARIPIAHIAGGDLTTGAIDDAFRHAITAMAHIHFVTNRRAARRVWQLGQAPADIHVVGSPGLDLILAAPVMTHEEFFEAISFRPRTHNLLVTFHPVTRAPNSRAQANELTAALAACGGEIGIIITGPNADPEGEAVGHLLRKFAETADNACFIAHLGSVLYANALRHCDAIVGNSSSGLYEAPSFGIPTVNIGMRQAGRLEAASVIDCAPDRAAIAGAIEAAFGRGRTPVENPYGDGHASERIIGVLKSIRDPQALFAKSFGDLPC